ncbi:hypothetical protein QR680_012873 [Steinernema hermaphroditum]|uniref:Signal recognition particle 9 kDa protein n=1 Tax=Steinernema hermaphroditum TaxID=289476 RepID=A0AA39I502_9BILA|nr:hypothetical protein QR680_012873 [Steinernema hermaphroditum]
MTYFTSWDEFARAVEELYAGKPQKCRFVVKYDHKKGKMVLKMTDDVKCLQYGTDQLQDVKRLEKLTGSLMRSITTEK